MIEEPFLGSPWMEIVRPDALSKLGDVYYAVFDFDGTISAIRQGWEHIMVPLMVEMICQHASLLRFLCGARYRAV
jgi:hypothetical protein